MNYIGISKLCCLDCHAVIYGVNHATGYNNQIEIRGAHNVKHSGKWKAPFNITGEPHKLSPSVIYTSSNNSGRNTRGNGYPEPFTKAIIDAYDIAIRSADNYDEETGKEFKGAVGVSEYANFSGSSSEDEEEKLLNEVLRNLTKKKAQLELENARHFPKMIFNLQIFNVINKLLFDLKNEMGALYFWITSNKAENILAYLKSLYGRGLEELEFALIVGELEPARIAEKSELVRIAVQVLMAIQVLSDCDFVGDEISNKFKRDTEEKFSKLAEYSIPNPEADRILLASNKAQHQKNIDVNNNKSKLFNDQVSQQVLNKTGSSGFEGLQQQPYPQNMPKDNDNNNNESGSNNNREKKAKKK